MATKMKIDPVRPAICGGRMVGDMSLATVYRVARLIVADEQRFARVHRISNDAVELSSGLELTPGQAILVDFSETTSVDARVSERHGQRCILMFERRINCAEVLRQLVAEARSSRARPLRLVIPQTATRATSAMGVHSLELQDISQRGMKVRHDGSFQPGLRVLVQLPNGRECRGIVRWTRDDRSGLQLIDTLSTEELTAVGNIAKPPC
jgi:hypothetical protein